jgi:purine-binding chemotaxis protein CheW
MIVHRRSAVPVLCLSQVLGRAPLEQSATSCLLLVDVDGEQIAFAVQSLRGIDPLTWADADQVRGRPIPVLSRALNTSPLVQVGTETRLVPDLDLFEVARAVRGYGADEVPRFDEAALQAELSRI